MAAKANSALRLLNGLNRLPIARQLTAFTGLAVSVALGVAVVLWSQGTDYRPLTGSFDNQDIEQAMQLLTQAGIQNKVDPQSGNILVASSDYQTAKLKLAGIGLPRSDHTGYESIANETGLGMSQFMEQVRYLRALEGELARTVMNIKSVKDARVHLAVPRETVFVTDDRKPTASVWVQLYPGYQLQKEEVASIVHLVASSVPSLSPDDVTVVDQEGHLLSGDDSDDEMSMALRQLNYKHELENNYAKRIESILSSLVGEGKVKAEVSADVDFASQEQTQENYDPKSQVVRSEQTMTEQRNTADAAAGGVAGAQSNRPAQPPSGAVNSKTALSPNAPHDERSQEIKNFEIDHTIKYTKQPFGEIKRLTVAVLLDYKSEMANGKLIKKPLLPNEVTYVDGLVKDAVGFNAQRGDVVNIVNSPFATPPEPGPLPQAGFWTQPWFFTLVKQILAGGFVLLLVIFVLRPMMTTILSKAIDDEEDRGLPGYNPSNNGGNSGSPKMVENQPRAQLSDVKNLATDSPLKVAQVMKNWVGE